MKHLCKDCINCECISKDFGGYETKCSLYRIDSILGRVKQCKHYEKKYLTISEAWEKQKLAIKEYQEKLSEIQEQLNKYIDENIKKENK